MLLTDAHTSELLAQAQKGNKEALGALYDRYHTGVFHYLYYRVGDVHLAEDLTADVFLRMVQALASFLPHSVSLQAWLFQVARNLAIDHYRRASTRTTVALEDTLPAGVDTRADAEQRLTHQDLALAFEDLSAEQRDVIILRFIVGISLAQTGHILHKSEDAVKGLQRRALQALRERLKAWKVEDEKSR
jgi:RNA polymerase sigma-70 factor (ECF subfamily)